MVRIIDNDHADRESLRLLLDCVGVEADTFPSSEAFLHTRQPAHKECVVLDIQMPGMSGVDLLKELRKRGDKVPVIVVTGRWSDTHAARATAAGALAVLEKPYKPSEMLSLIRTALEEDRGHVPAAIARAR